MSKKNEQKKGTIKPSTVEVFGVTATSTGADAVEMMEMLAFLGDCSQEHVIHYVNSVVYDTETKEVTLSINKVCKEKDPVSMSLYRKAIRVFPKFQWYGELVDRASRAYQNKY